MEEGSQKDFLINPQPQTTNDKLSDNKHPAQREKFVEVWSFAQIFLWVKSNKCSENLWVNILPVAFFLFSWIAY